MHDLHRYLLLAPGARDAAAVKQKLTALELLANERRPWLPFLSSYNGADGEVTKVTLRGRSLAIIVVTPERSVRHDYTPGDTVFHGTIHGSDVQGKWVMRRKDPLLVKCLGAVSEYDANGHAGPDALTIRAFTNVRFDTSSCEITSQEWQVAGRYPAPIVPAASR